MKKFNLIIALLCVVGIVNAQRTISEKVSVDMAKFNIEKAVTDTIMPAGWDADSATYFTTSNNGQFAGFVTGINTYADAAKLQEFTATTPYQVEGGLMLIPVKMDTDEANANDGSFDYVVYTFDADTPSVIAASKTVTYAQIDTLGFTVAMFDAPLSVTGKYAAGIDMTGTFDGTAILSLYTLASSTDGLTTNDASWEQWSDGGMKKISVAWSGLMIDLGVFPVINTNGVGIEEASFVNGVKVNCFPNPTTDVLNVEYALENAAKVNVKVANMNGQIIMEVAEGFKSAGTYTSTLDVNNLANGTYFVTIQAGTSRIAQRVVVQ